MKPAAVDQSDSRASETTDASGRAARAVTPSAKPVIAIKLAGKEYRIRSDASEEWLQQVAGYVDQAMQNIRERTDTVDSLDIALLTALNLAREVLSLRTQVSDEVFANDISDVRLRDLIEQIELELPEADRDQ